MILFFAKPLSLRCVYLSCRDTHPARRESLSSRWSSLDSLAGAWRQSVDAIWSASFLCAHAILHCPDQKFLSIFRRYLAIYCSFLLTGSSISLWFATANFSSTLCLCTRVQRLVLCPLLTIIDLIPILPNLIFITLLLLVLDPHFHLLLKYKYRYTFKN